MFLMDYTKYILAMADCLGFRKSGMIEMTSIGRISDDYVKVTVEYMIPVNEFMRAQDTFHEQDLKERNGSGK